MRRSQTFRWISQLFFIATIALIGCGDSSNNAQMIGPDTEAPISAYRLAKPGDLPATAFMANVVVQVTHPDGAPATGLEITFSQSVAGRVPGVAWTGTTDTEGQAEVAIEVSPEQFSKTGATGYYTARAVNPQTGQTMERWHSIPVNSGENVLSLAIGGKVKVHPRGTRFNIMTRNLYWGADIKRILAPSDPSVPLPVVVAQAWQMAQHNNFPERARAIADEIAAARPHLVGLQECTLFRMQTPGDVLAGNPVPATEVVLDFLQILLDELEARGLSYQAAAISQGADFEVPIFTGPDAPLSDIRLTNLDVILARSGVQIQSVVTKQYDVKVPISIGGIPTSIPRAWASVEATVASRTVRFFTTHLETSGAGPIQRLQAGELLQVIAAESLPVIVAGDFNSDAYSTTTDTYAELIDAGLVDVLAQLYPDRVTFTASLGDEDLLLPDRINRRIDHVFIREGDGFAPIQADVVGEEEADRTPSGLWPSDHAGVTASVRLPAQKPF